MNLQETADYLATSGFPDAAAFLRGKGGVATESHYLHDLQHKDSFIADSLLKSDPPCRIWSNEHLAWWRANAAGYTTQEIDAGVYTFQDAWKRTSHCDVTKGIVFEVWFRA